MAGFTKIRQQQLLQEVEGYLDLTMVLSDRFPVTVAARNRVAQRALSTLENLDGEIQSSMVGLHLRGQALRIMERYEEAVEPLAAAQEKDPENLHIQLALGWCYKRIGKVDAAIQSLETALAFCPDEGIVHYNLACYWSLANNVPLALVYLAQSFDLDASYRDMVATEPDFDTLRDHPEFVALTSVTV